MILCIQSLKMRLVRQVGSKGLFFEFNIDVTHTRVDAMACRERKLSVYFPVRIAPTDAITLDRVAKSRNLPRSEILRELIRSLSFEKPESSTSECSEGASLDLSFEPNYSIK